MIGRTAVAPLSDNIFIAETLTAVTVAAFHPAIIAYAATAVFPFHGVAKVTRGAQITRLAVGIVQTLQTLAGDTVARVDLIGVNIAGALARLAIIAVYLGISIVAGGASLATGTVISGQTVTANLIALLIHLAAGGKVIGGGRQRACTDQTIRRCAHSGVTVVTLFAEFAMIANGAILAILQKASHRRVTDKKNFEGILSQESLHNSPDRSRCLHRM